MSKTPSSALNLKIRGKRITFSPEDENLISTALSLIWIKTNKSVESCYFENDTVRLCLKKNEGRVYFDLSESLASISEVIIFFSFVQFLCHIFLDNFVHLFVLRLLFLSNPFAIDNLQLTILFFFNYRINCEKALLLVQLVQLIL